MIESDGRGITYTSFDLPRTITQGPNKTTFKYDAFGARVKKTVAPIADPENPISTTVTLAGLYERRTEAGKADHRFYVYGDGEPVGEVVFHEGGAADDTRYLVRDGHGSIGLVLEPDGTVLERLYYEPFGGRVDVAGAPVAGAASGVRRGFTGHEEDDDLGLINMKGRVYDPVLRRFWTPDPIVGNPLAGQTWNPYSYVWNNPLRYVDPTGLLGEDDDDSGSIWTKLYNGFVDFVGGDKEVVYKNKSEKQLLPAGGGSDQKETQTDEGSSSSSVVTVAPEPAQKVARSNPGVPKSPATSANDLLKMLVPLYGVADVTIGNADTNIGEVKKAGEALAQNNPSLAADHLLAIPENMGREAGAVILNGVKGAMDLPGDARDFVRAESTRERVQAAVATGGDAIGIAGLVLLGSGAGQGSGSRGGVGDLTTAEVEEIQSVVDEAGRPLEIVGSAAKGVRRAVGTNLPIGKGPGTRSDIDFLAPPSSHPYFKGLEERLPSLDPRTGIIPGVHNPHIGPAVRFEPGAKPYFVPGGS